MTKLRHSNLLSFIRFYIWVSLKKGFCFVISHFCNLAPNFENDYELSLKNSEYSCKALNIVAFNTIYVCLPSEKHTNNIFLAGEVSQIW